MKIIHHPRDLAPAPHPVCLAIGMFDGVHLGHQQVLRQTVTDAHQHGASPLAVTFDRHPNSVVAPARTPPLIYSLAQKLQVLASSGVSATLVIPFDRAFSRWSAEEFIGWLAREFGRLQSVCVGSGFTFGHNRRGNVELLTHLGQELRFTVHSLAAVSLDGKTVSSTLIRQAIQTGDLDHASQMLGRPYSISARVIEGARLGRKLGFPTANLDVPGRVLPPHGVYAVQVVLQSQTWKAVANIGCRPTLGQTLSVQVEAHLLDFHDDLYGRELELVFVDKLRDEQRFPSPSHLRRQIERDIAAARALLG